MEDHYEDTETLETAPKFNFPTISWMAPAAGIVGPAKKRGRPKKHLPKVEGVTLHKSDVGPVFKMLSSKERTSIERRFQDLQKSGMPVREAIESLAECWEVPYRQIYEITAKFF